MNTNSIIKIRDARLPNDIDFIKKLWTDYLTWGNDKMQMLYGVHPHNPIEAVKDDIKKIDKFLPPNGRLIMAFVDEKACGIGCQKVSMKKLAKSNECMLIHLSGKLERDELFSKHY